MFPKFEFGWKRVPLDLASWSAALPGSSLGLLVLLMAFCITPRSISLDARDRRPANEHALAAAIRGEIVAMANWISTQAASLQENTRPQDNADLNDDMPNERLGSSSLPARPIYESNANRSYICGGVLSEAVPYTYAPVWNRPSWKRPVKYEPNSVELRLKRLQNAEVSCGRSSRTSMRLYRRQTGSEQLADDVQEIYENHGLL